MGRGEVLENREAFHKVAFYRLVYDLALSVRDQATHTGELGNLGVVTPGTRVGHHVDRVEAVEIGLHRVLDLVLGLGPKAYDPLEALLVGDKTTLPLVLDLIDQRVVLLEDLSLLLRHYNIVFADRDPGARGRMEPDPL